jgi:RNA polymerase sigma-70 factor, ECF subfamily
LNASTNMQPPVPMPPEQEKALVEGLGRRDPRSVRAFLGLTHKPVYAMTGRLTGDRDLRHDWTHEIILKVLDELSDGRFVYRWPGCFWSWFRKRSYYLLINQYNAHRKLTSRYQAGDVGQEIIERLPLHDDTNPQRLIESVEARAAVESCLNELPSADHRRALHMLLFEEMAYQDIAQATGTELNTIRSWIRRARISVRSCLTRKYKLSTQSRKD